MFTKHINRILVVMLVTLGAPMGLGYAGTITAVDPGGNFNLTGILRPTPNNDDFTGAGAAAPNSIGAGKIFTTNDAMLHSFNVSNSGGTTEYFFAERVENKTGIDWIDFHFELFGPGNDDGLDFDTGTPANPQKTPTPIATAFSTLNHQPDTLDWSGGLVKNGGSVFFTFSIDVPDSMSRFTLLEKPSVVPEPSAVFLFGSGLAAGIGFKQFFRRVSPHTERTSATISF